MDHSKFIRCVQQFPLVWDRNCANFREREEKKTAWDEIGITMNCSGNVCKDTFKSLREKYVREREKQAMFGDKYVPWQHLDALKFLDPHIMLRKQSFNSAEETKTAEEYRNFFGENETENPVSSDVSHDDFDRRLIQLVRKATPIWDRKSNSYPSKQMKFQLWKGIADTIGRDVNVCMLRWKGLREKYIRQKGKHQDGEGKWEFLDLMAFLDRVIQYRRKQLEYDYQHFPLNCEVRPYEDTDSSSDVSRRVKTEMYDYDAIDSSYDSGASSMPPLASCGSRKRSSSDYSETSSAGKRDRNEEEQRPQTPPQHQTRSPEQMFGELVAAMLAKKAERDKNVAMIEIMKILTRE